MKTKALLFLLLAGGLHAQWSLAGYAGLTCWGAKCESNAVPPGWGYGLTQRAHPVGAVEAQYQWRKVGIFGQLEGDPHRAGEASGLMVGLHRDFFHVKRLAVFGTAGVGIFKGPNWAQYGCTYEWMNCYVEGPPEECWWEVTDLGVGSRERLSNHLSLEQVADYKSVYGIGPRWSFKVGFRVGL